jgi:hypothetical protein
MKEKYYAEIKITDNGILVYGACKSKNEKEYNMLVQSSEGGTLVEINKEEFDILWSKIEEIALTKFMKKGIKEIQQKAIKDYISGTLKMEKETNN